MTLHKNSMTSLNKLEKNSVSICKLVKKIKIIKLW